MKVIQVIGSSGSGKTTFILKLAKKLSEIGKTGTIKHLGHHTFMLEDGKDTTLHYQSGVSAAIGIDDEKSVATIRCNGIEEGLSLLSDLGMDYAVVEGFKSVHLPCIVIGNLESDYCIMRDPTVEETISNLDGFSDYYTIQGLISGIDSKNNIITASIKMKEVAEDSTCDLSEIPGEIESIILDLPGIDNVKCRLSKNPFSRHDCTLFVVFSVEDIGEGNRILSKTVRYIEDKITIRF